MKTMRFIGIVLALFSAGSPPAAQAQDSGKKYKVYMVSNSHLDTQWRWDVKATIDDYLYNTAVQNLALLEKYPHYVFNFEGAVKYEWIKEYYPHLFERIRKFVADGRWNISGASFEANDPNMPSSESFIRNILLAQEFYKKEFGIKSKDMFLPDCFGFSQVMPTLGHHCGLIGFSTQKLSWRTEPLVGDSKTPFPIGLWEGVDGARIMVALEPGRYSWNEFPEGDLSANKELVESARKSPFGIAYRYYGNKLANGAGDHGGSALPRSIQLLEEGITNGKGPVQLVSATSSQLYEDYMPYGNHPELPVFVGEMPLDVHAPGCYTSQAEMKRYNRRNEQLADAAERSAVIADWMGAVPYPKEALNDAWKRFLWHQFHDDLTGTSIWEAYTYSWNDEFLAQGQFCDVILASAGAAASVMDTRAKGSPVLVYNPAAYSRRSLVEATVDLPAEAEGVAVYAPDGKTVPAQIVARDGARATVLFAAAMEPVSYAVYDVRAGKAGKGKVLRASGNTLENRVYKVTLDANGDIASVIDKRNGRDLVEKGKAFRLAVLTPNGRTERHGETVARLLEGFRLQDGAHRDNLRILVGYFYTHRSFAGNRGYDTHTGGGQREGYVVHKVAYLGYLDTGFRNYLVKRDGRADRCFYLGDGNAEVEKCLAYLLLVFKLFFIVYADNLTAVFKQVEGGEFPGSAWLGVGAGGCRRINFAYVVLRNFHRFETACTRRRFCLGILLFPRNVCFRNCVGRGRRGFFRVFEGVGEILGVDRTVGEDGGIGEGNSLLVLIFLLTLLRDIFAGFRRVFIFGALHFVYHLALCLGRGFSLAFRCHFFAMFTHEFLNPPDKVAQADYTENRKHHYRKYRSTGITEELHDKFVDLASVVTSVVDNSIGGYGNQSHYQ